ncbi:protein kinase domain-containing protein [Streptosporangium sp. NPDC004631]
MSDSQEIIGARYRLLEHIGRGGMGTVWRARDEVLGRDVAVKEVIPSPDLTGPEREVFTVRTLREARAAGRVGHPGVATVYDVIEEDGRPWIVMQLVESRTLGAVIREDGPLPPARVARIGLEVLGALVAAHHAGVLHRDVKPDNVLLARDGRAVLTDFGIAVLEGDSSVTRTGALIGTPAFIAPERASGGTAEFASDLWSLGVTLYVAVEGRSPFERAHPLATLSAVMHEEPAPLRLAGPLGPVIYGLLRRHPRRRMSAQEVQIHLRSIVNGTAPQATMPIDLPSPAPARAPVTGEIADPVPHGPVDPEAAGPGAAAPVPAPAAPGGRRRRSAAAALVAAVLAIVTTAGGAAWVAMSSAPPASQEPTPPRDAPTGDDARRTRTEQARLPTGGDSPPPGTGRDTRRAPARPAPADRSSKSGKPEENGPSPSPKPSDTPSEQSPENDTGTGGGESESVPEDGQSPGQGPGKNPGEGGGQNQDGDQDNQSGQDGLGGETNAVAGSAPGMSAYGKAGGPHRAETVEAVEE